MITTRELAELAGVNQSTVSRCLSDKPGISEETRRRVLEIAKREGYPVGGAARGEARKDAIVVLLSESFFPKAPDFFLDSLFEAMFREIEKRRYLPLMAFDRSRSEGWESIESLVGDGRVAGFIIIDRDYDAELDRRLAERGMPHVYTHYFGKNSVEAIDIIDTDQYMGGFLAARHLIELGHRRLLTVTSTGREFEDRSAGFEAAVKAAGNSIEKSGVLATEYTYDAGYRLGRERLDALREYSALFVQNDLAALGLLNALQDEGVAVPGEISIVGYDDIEAGRFSRPALTTVRQPVADLASTTVDRLVKRIANPKGELLRSYVQPSLVLRGSTGPAPI